MSDVLLGCQCQIRPERMLACSSGVDTLLNIAGNDANGNRFILTESCWGGWGGRRASDGIEFITPPSHNNSNTPIEVNEQIYPAILYDRYGFVADTEGAGRHRGAVALAREWTYRGSEDGVLQLRVDRRTRGPYGVDGGEAGAPLSAIINPGSDRAMDTGKITTTLRPGDRLRIQVAGAGGWGPAGERDPEAVMTDVRNGLVSPERAREVYRVALDETGRAIDNAETASLRGNDGE